MKRHDGSRRRSSAPVRGIGIMVIACLLFPAGDSIAKHLVGTYHVLMILWLKFLFQTASVVLVILLTQSPRAFHSRRPGVQIGRGLAGIGFDPDESTLMIWEGNTMYLPPESIMPFLNGLAAAIPSLRIAFDYFAADLQNREFESDDDRRRLEGVEQAMGASFPCGFPDLAVFEQEAPFRVAEEGSFSGLAHDYGLADTVAEYPEDWRETLKLYRYCVLKRR